MFLLDGLGHRLAHYLTKQRHDRVHYTTSQPATLARTLRPGDVLLVEGSSRISAAIKYLTQSTWQPRRRPSAGHATNAKVKPQTAALGPSLPIQARGGGGSIPRAVGAADRFGALALDAAGFGQFLVSG